MDHSLGSIHTFWVIIYVLAAFCSITGVSLIIIYRAIYPYLKKGSRRKEGRSGYDFPFPKLFTILFIVLAICVILPTFSQSFRQGVVFFLNQYFYLTSPNDIIHFFAGVLILFFICSLFYTKSRLEKIRFLFHSVSSHVIVAQRLAYHLNENNYKERLNGIVDRIIKALVLSHKKKHAFTRGIAGWVFLPDYDNQRFDMFSFRPLDPDLQKICEEFKPFFYQTYFDEEQEFQAITYGSICSYLFFEETTRPIIIRNIEMCELADYSYREHLPKESLQYYFKSLIGIKLPSDIDSGLYPLGVLLILSNKNDYFYEEDKYVLTTGVGHIARIISTAYSNNWLDRQCRFPKIPIELYHEPIKRHVKDYECTESSHGNKNYVTLKLSPKHELDRILSGRLFTLYRQPIRLRDSEFVFGYEIYSHGPEDSVFRMPTKCIEYARSIGFIKEHAVSCLQTIEPRLSKTEFVNFKIFVNIPSEVLEDAEFINIATRLKQNGISMVWEIQHHRNPKILSECIAKIKRMDLGSCCIDNVPWDFMDILQEVEAEYMKIPVGEIPRQTSYQDKLRGFCDKIDIIITKIGSRQDLDRISEIPAGFLQGFIIGTPQVFE